MHLWTLSAALPRALPVLLMEAWRRELAAVFMTKRPFGHLGRGVISIFGMFLNFAALARLPLVDATAISLAAPLITVALAALMLGEHASVSSHCAASARPAARLPEFWQPRRNRCRRSSRCQNGA